MQNNSFLDSRTLLAIVAVMGILFGWNSYMSKKYPSLDQRIDEEKMAINNPVTDPAASPTNSNSESTTDGATAEAQPGTTAAEKKFFSYSDELLAFRVSNYGMGLHDIVIKKFTDREGKQVVFDTRSDIGSFETRLLGVDDPLVFEVEKLGDTFVGRSVYNGLKIKKTLKINRDQYTIDSEVEIVGLGVGVEGVDTLLVDKVNEPVSTGWMMPTFDIQSVYVDYGAGENSERFTLENKSYADVADDFGGRIPETKKIVEDSINGVAVAAVDRHYFTTAVIDKSKIQPELTSYYKYNSPKGEADFYTNAIGRLSYKLPRGRDKVKLEYKLYAGPKSYDTLVSIDKRLGHLVDFGYGGWLDFIAYPLFRLMKFLFGVTGNYGWAIIFLTIIVRLLVMPFHIMSLRSMKNMSKYQPQMKEIREKFKDDPKVQQQEIMNFMRAHKINPLGGCLPMLLQMPVFFALYRVLYQSIELYQAPFIFWIQDLSYKDPFYVLPVLMGLTLFIQQKITPNTMDPAQAKMMLIMPVIFSLFMLSLPSGLNLYIFVSTLIGVVQHILFMRDKAVPARQPANARA